jgi:serine phosphatase RsbU (regulator of sigma subunit)
MDISLCVIDRKDNTLHFSGAHNPAWIIRGKNCFELKADKQPIGIYLDEHNPFSREQFALQQGDHLYLFTDGYADQFGGPKGKKFKYKQLQKLLLASIHLPMEEQKRILDDTLTGWKGMLEQVDDILVIGIRI